MYGIEIMYTLFVVVFLIYDDMHSFVGRLSKSLSHSDGQSVEFDESSKVVVWMIKKLHGNSTASAKFKVSKSTTRHDRCYTDLCLM